MPVEAAMAIRFVTEMQFVHVVLHHSPLHIQLRMLQSCVLGCLRSGGTMQTHRIHTHNQNRQQAAQPHMCILVFRWVLVGMHRTYVALGYPPKSYKSGASK